MWYVGGGWVGKWGSLYVMDDSSPALTKLFANTVTIILIFIVIVIVIVIVIPHRMII